MKLSRILFRFAAIPLVFLSALPALAQTVVTSNAGDQTTPNSLGWAISNMTTAGAISIESSVGPIILSQPFATASYTVTFQGTNSDVIAQEDSQAQFLFQNGFTLDTGASITFTNNGALASGLDAAMTAASWTLNNNSSFSLSGGVTSPQSGAASLTAGAGLASSGSSFQIAGGAGTPGGGNGGAASVSFTSLSMSGSTGTVAGGAGGGDTFQNGNGGSATLSLDSLEMDTDAQLGLTGGNGGVSTTGGLGNGGNAVLAATSVSLTGSGTQLAIISGSGGMPEVVSSSPGPANAGAAGAAEFSAGSVTVDSNAILSITGGAGGTVQATSSGTGGMGGGATVLMGTLSLTNGGSLGVTAGAGGQGSRGAVGGAAFVTVGTADEQSGSTFSITSGAGGGNQSGGSLQFIATSQTLASGATFIATGSAGGSGAATGGNGGTVNVSASNLTLASGSLWEAVGGAGGTGTVTNGQGGSVTAFVDNLQGSGTITMAGPGQDILKLNSGSFSGSIEGSEELLVTAYGVVQLTGTNTYSGGTYLSNGTLIATSDANMGTGNITLDAGALESEGPPSDPGLTTSKAISLTTNGGTLDVANGGTANYFDGVISGPGGLGIDGGSLAILNAANSYAGPTTVLSATLELGDGGHTGAEIAGPVTVAPAGILTGNGSILGAVTNNGIVQGGSPNSMGTLAVAGYTQTSSGLLQTDLSPTQASLLSVNGTASLSGGVTLYQTAGTYDDFRYHYLILSAGSINGSFSGTMGALLPEWAAALSYSSDMVSLLLYRTNITFTPWAVGANQTAVAEALDAAVSLGSDSLADKLGELDGLPSGQTLALGQLTGDIYTALPDILTDNLQFEDSLIFDRLDGNVGTGMGGAQAGLVRDLLSAEVSGPAGNAAGLASPGVGGLWVENTDSAGTVNSNDNVEGFNKSNTGFLAGYDAQLMPNLTGGLMGGYVHTDVTGVYTGATAGINSIQFDAYGSRQFSKFAVGAILGLSLNQFTANRSVSLGSDVNQLSAAFNGTQVQAALQGSYALDLSGFTVKPLAGVQYSQFTEKSFTETGSDSLALSIPAQSFESLRPYVGVEGSKYFTVDQDLGLLPRVNVSVSQELMDDTTSFSTSLNGDPGNSFTVAGITPSATTASLEAGAKLVFGKQFNLFANYQGHFSGTENLNTFNGGVDISF